MVSRRALKRKNENTPTHAVEVNIIKPGERWPKFFKLYEHQRFHTVIMLPSKNALLEVEQMMQKGNAACTHKDELDDCIHIEETSIEEWLATHPGEQQ